MRKVVRVIDEVNGKVGMAVRWVALGMLLITTYEVVSRYFFDAPTIWAHQSVMMLGGVLVVLSYAWVHLRHGHVAMDILFRHLPPKGQAITNIVCSLLFFFPLIGLLTYVSGYWMVESWVFHERWTVSIWEPPMWPSKAFLTLGFVLFFFQGAAHLVRDLHFVVRGEKL